MRIIVASVLLLIVYGGFAQKKSSPLPTGQAPKLVVGIVVDQMRWDYLTRYQSRYTNGGFKRMIRDGFSHDNAFIQFTPTFTAAGHASVYTGTVPALNGIIGNNWYSRMLGRVVYCTDDSTVSAVGSNSNAGKMSPLNLWSSGICDEIRLSTNFRSKVIGIAIKDRGAILPAGHSANAAYWFDNSIGGFISSTYYMKELPGWMTEFNARNLAEKYMSTDWNTLFPINTYVQSSEDEKKYEGILGGEDYTFPHTLPAIKNNRFEVFKNTPFANSYTFEAGKAAIEGEDLGTDEFTDVLAISFSSTDYIGHTFGPNSIEMEDTYLRFDRDLEAFFNYLDKKIGKGQYLTFLTADHGAAHVPGFLNEHNMPAGTASGSAIRTSLNNAVQKELNISNAVSSVINYQVYLDYEKVKEDDREKVESIMIKELLKRPEVSQAFSLADAGEFPLPLKVVDRVRNGYNQKLSGDIQYLLKPAYFEGGSTGTTHGAWNPYDAHIPLIWMGWKIKPGRSGKEVYMTDIAPTLADLLKIQAPNASIGDALFAE